MSMPQSPDHDLTKAGTCVKGCKRGGGGERRRSIFSCWTCDTCVPKLVRYVAQPPRGGCGAAAVLARIRASAFSIAPSDGCAFATRRLTKARTFKLYSTAFVEGSYLVLGMQ